MKATREVIVDLSIDDDETFMVIINRTDKYERTLPTYVMIDGVRYTKENK